VEKVLNQQEIDGMVRAARGQKIEQTSLRGITVKPCTFRDSGQLSPGQVQAANGLHESFARSLAQSLSAYLRVMAEATLVSVEQLVYGEFLERVPAITYMASFTVPELEASAAMQIDHSLVFPFVDILLGGPGRSESMSREVSEIEEQIVEGIAKIVCRELAIAWMAFGTGLQFDKRQSPAQMQRFLPPTEKTLCLTFEIKAGDSRGVLNLLFPRSISNTLLRKLWTEGTGDKSKRSHSSARRLREKMKNCPFSVTLGLDGITLPAKTVIGLMPGQICNLGVPVHTSASLLIGGRSLFEAKPVRLDKQRAAQIGMRIASIPEETTY
jgi:flagellar motor switch protein FliM